MVVKALSLMERKDGSTKGIHGAPINARPKTFKSKFRRIIATLLLSSIGIGYGIGVTGCASTKTIFVDKKYSERFKEKTIIDAEEFVKKSFKLAELDVMVLFGVNEKSVPPKKVSYLLRSDTMEKGKRLLSSIAFETGVGYIFYKDKRVKNTLEEYAKLMSLLMHNEESRTYFCWVFYEEYLKQIKYKWRGVPSILSAYEVSLKIRDLKASSREIIYILIKTYERKEPPERVAQNALAKAIEEISKRYNVKARPENFRIKEISIEKLTQDVLGVK